MEPFLGELKLVPYTFAPRGWAFCQGQIISISQNTALFSLLGTTYGGDGRVTFALPDLRGRVAVSSGQGPGLSPYALGERGGSETETLDIYEMPAHNHFVNVLGGGATTTRSPGSYLASGGSYGAAPDGNMLGPQAISFAGQGLPHSNIQPYLTLNWCIALEGVYPSRN